MKITNFFVEHIEYIIFGIFCLIVYLNVHRRKAKHQKAHAALQKAIKTQMDEPLTLHPEIDSAKCAGCGSCTLACPEGEILQLINHRAVLVSPTKCVGHGECEVACPFEAITLVFGTKKRGLDIPRVTKDYETNVPGIYIAGELGGMGLIRNAIKQGLLATNHAISKLQPNMKTDFDIAIIGAGPAGLSSALCCIAKGKKYKLIDQNSFGGTVYNFPRQKIVMTHPADLACVGTMKFQNNVVQKEELLAYWKKVQKVTHLKVDEGVKFENLEKTDNHFVIKTSKGSFTSQKIILAMGVRGSPRKLGLPNEDLPKVTYNLIDPEQYQHCHVAVVGGGNAGVEAAQYLGNSKLKNKVTLLVRGPAFDRCNEENKHKIEDMAKKGLVDIWYNSSVQKINEKTLEIKKETNIVTIPNDFLFIYAGAELPTKFLMSLGVVIDKKFGEALDKGASKK